MIRLAVIVFTILSLSISGCAQSYTIPPDQTPLPQEPQQESETHQEQPSPTSSRSPSDMVPRIAIGELLHKIQNNEEIVIVDAREEPELQYYEEHIAGAISVPLSVIIAEKWRPVKIDQETILYCS